MLCICWLLNVNPAPLTHECNRWPTYLSLCYSAGCPAQIPHLKDVARCQPWSSPWWADVTQAGRWPSSEAKALSCIAWVIFYILIKTVLRSLCLIIIIELYLMHIACINSIYNSTKHMHASNWGLNNHNLQHIKYSAY